MSNELGKDMKNRVPFWDNLKGLLIILVVFAHFLYSFQEDPLIRTVVSSIYFFHMPAFVFTSGYLSKSTKSRNKRSLLTLFVMYILFNGLLMFATAREEPNAVTPYYVMWYIFALIFWRLTVEDFSQIKGIVLIMLCCALICGLWDTITNSFALERIICYYPFFMAGYLLDEGGLKLLDQKRGKRLLSGLIALAVAVILTAVSLHHFSFTADDLTMSCYDSYSGIIMRALIFAVSALAIYSMICLVPRKSIPFVSMTGRNTLAIYLCHRPITLVFAKLCPSISSYLLLAVCAAATVAVVALFGNDFINRLLMYFIKLITGVFYGEMKNYSTLEKAFCALVFLYVILLSILPVYSRLL